MTFSARFANMFKFIKKLLGLDTPEPKKVESVVTFPQAPKPVVHVELITPVVTEKPKKKRSAPRKTTTTRKPRKKKE